MSKLVPAICAVLLTHAAAGEDVTGFYGARIAAERVTVVSGGGHFPVLTRLDNGDLLAAVRGGATHVGVKGRLDVARSTDGGRTWSLQTVADEPADDRNPAIGQLRDGTVLLVYLVDRSYGPDGEVPPRDKMVLRRDSLYIARSLDCGRTWQPPVKSPIAVERGASAFGKIVQLADGTALLAVYYLEGRRETEWKESSLVYRSRDGGLTWGDPSVIAENFNETALVVLPGDRLMAAMRGGKGRFLSATFSDDKGRTWSAPRRVTADWEHPGDAIVLRDGRLLLTFGSRNRPYGVRALLSRNLGVDWDPRVIVLAADAHTTDCGYASTVETAPGKLVTIYYGVDGSYDPYGKDSKSLSRSYARAVLWTAPE